MEVVPGSHRTTLPHIPAVGDIRPDPLIVKRAGDASPADLAMREAREQSWYHTIDLPDGSSTRGVFDNRGVARLVQWPAELPGGRCLDVGTCDGFWAFEMERRGAADVTAIDVDEPGQLDWSWESRRNPDATRAWWARRGRRFDIARRALGSRVNRIACSVYDLNPSIHGQFDVVFFGTLLVHLRDPVLALERMREVCAGELVLVECLDALLDVIARPVPCARFAPAPEQWWRFNRAGLLRMLRVAGFDVLWASRRFHTPFGPSATHYPYRFRPIRAGRAAVARMLRAFPGAPVLADAVGLALGTYDVAVRARPRPPVARP
jgi:tRNA (mo5U34)-methyltransferase